MIERIVKLSAAALILFATLNIGAAFAHGNVALEDDSCIRGTEGSRVHFSTYQPQYDIDAEYCSEIPKTGKTFWVVDIVDQALRDMPIGIQIVKGSGKTLSDTVVASFHSINHSDGVINGESDLDKGVYTVLITGEGAVPPVHYKYPLRVQKSNFFFDSRFSYATGPLIAILLLLFAVYTNKLLRHKRISH